MKMWPFKKKKEAKPVEPNFRLAMIKKMQEWRSVGEEFEYLGRRMIVAGHWRIGVHGFPGVLCVEPCLSADYADNNGVIHSVSFSNAEIEALMRAQPNN
jgi:hypothetical protein